MSALPPDSTVYGGTRRFGPDYLPAPSTGLPPVISAGRCPGCGAEGGEGSGGRCAGCGEARI